MQSSIPMSARRNIWMANSILAMFCAEGSATSANLVVDALILYIPASAMAPNAAHKAHTKLNATRNLRATGKLRNRFIGFPWHKIF